MDNDNTTKCAHDLCDETFEKRVWNHSYCSNRCKNQQARLRELSEHTKGIAEEYYSFADTKTWEQREASLIRQIDKERSRTAAILEIIQNHTPPRLGPIDTPNSPANEPVDAHIMLADTQIGKLNRGRGIETTKRYIKVLHNHISEYIYQMAHFNYVEKIYLHALGDLIENCQMFPTQPYELDYENGGHLVIKQVLIVADLIEWLIRNLHRLDTPIVVTNAPGNHGRRAPSKNRDVSAVDDNFDTLVMLMVKKYCRDLDNITWNIPEDDWCSVIDSQGWRFATAHGHQFGGSTSSVFEKWVLNHNASGTWGAVDYVLLGHRHHPMTLTVGSGITVIQSGALDGGSDWFNQKSGKGMTPPSQELFFVSEQGIIQRHNIRVDNPEPRRNLYI